MESSNVKCKGGIHVNWKKRIESSSKEWWKWLDMQGSVEEITPYWEDR